MITIFYSTIKNIIVLLINLKKDAAMRKVQDTVLALIDVSYHKASNFKLKC